MVWLPFHDDSITLFKCHSHYWSLIMLMLVRSSYWTNSGVAGDLILIWCVLSGSTEDKKGSTNPYAYCVRYTPLPFPTKAHTKVVIKCEKHPLFADFGRKNTPFQPKSLIMRPNKTPLFKAKCDFFIIYALVPFLWKWEYMWRHQIQYIFVYVVFFITSKLWLNLKYIYA